MMDSSRRAFLKNLSRNFQDLVRPVFQFSEKNDKSETEWIEIGRYQSIVPNYSQEVEHCGMKFNILTDYDGIRVQNSDGQYLVLKMNRESPQGAIVLANKKNYTTNAYYLSFMTGEFTGE